MEERRYRLRQGPEIVGFLRDIHGSLFYSRDGFWWTGIPVRYEHVDEWTGWMDVQRKRIYEWDLVEYATTAVARGLQVIDPLGRWSEAYAGL